MTVRSRIATYLIAGTITLGASTIEANAAELPIAGMDVILNNYYQTEDYTDIREFLEQKKSEFANLGIADVRNYVNIRNKPSTKGEIVGKLYKNGAATIIDESDGWSKVKSSSVTGYIKSDYLITGDKVEDLAESLGTRIAKVDTTTLNVREKADTQSKVIKQVPNGEELKVVKEQDQWINIKLSNGKTGYVHSDYVILKTKFKEAESIKEEKARLATKSNNSSSSNYNSSSSSLGQRIANYALKFKGNPYVWGGTSLTKGADCSGFTQSIFKNFGVNIPRTSRAQARSGKTISLKNLQPGDLVFYGKNGRINHVAIYIGNGKVISAKSKKAGIAINNYNYRTPYKAVTYLR